MLGRPAEVNGRQVGLSCRISTVRCRWQRKKAGGVYFRRRLFFVPPAAFFFVDRLVFFFLEVLAFFLVDRLAFFLVDRLAFFLVDRLAFFLVDRLAFFRPAVFFVAISVAPLIRDPLDLGCYDLPWGTSKGKTPEHCHRSVRQA